MKGSRECILYTDIYAPLQFDEFFASEECQSRRLFASNGDAIIFEDLAVDKDAGFEYIGTLDGILHYFVDKDDVPVICTFFRGGFCPSTSVDKITYLCYPESYHGERRMVKTKYGMLMLESIRPDTVVAFDKALVMRS